MEGTDEQLARRIYDSREEPPGDYYREAIELARRTLVRARLRQVLSSMIEYSTKPCTNVETDLFGRYPGCGGTQDLVPGEIKTVRVWNSAMVFDFTDLGFPVYARDLVPAFEEAGHSFNN